MGRDLGAYRKGVKARLSGIIENGVETNDDKDRRNGVQLGES